MSDIIIAGVGGQGTVLASKLLAQAALSKGYLVRTAETIGMAQRGGSVLGHVRIAGRYESSDDKGGFRWMPWRSQRHRTGHNAPHDAPLSPLIPQGAADLLIGFEPGETVRALSYLRQGGTVVTAKQALEPVTAMLSALPYDGRSELAYLRGCAAKGRIGTLRTVDGAEICAELGSTRILNVVLLGAALSVKDFEVSALALTKAIESLVKPQYRELNTTALARGME
jgi:indolepyruvate ferredoxin oxidoreductase beta subunit